MSMKVMLSAPTAQGNGTTPSNHNTNSVKRRGSVNWVSHIYDEPPPANSNNTGTILRTSSNAGTEGVLTTDKRRQAQPLVAVEDFSSVSNNNNNNSNTLSNNTNNALNRSKKTVTATALTDVFVAEEVKPLRETQWSHSQTIKEEQPPRKFTIVTTEESVTARETAKGTDDGVSILDSAPQKRIAWRCGLCQYNVLSMDANGAPIPFSVSAFGEPLPLQCPQCLVEHTNWKQTVPFNKYGDHVNLRSRFSNRYMVQHNTKGNVSPTKGKEKNHFTSSYVTDCLYKEHDEGNASMEDRNKNMRYCIESLRQKMEYEISTAQPDATGKPVSSSVHTSQNNTMNTTTNNNSNTLSRARTTNAYYCGLCHRRLLRFGAEGELIPLSCDEEGRILPMRCPGCGVEHSDWELKGFAAGRMFLEGDTVVPRRG